MQSLSRLEHGIADWFHMPVEISAPQEPLNGAEQQSPHAQRDIQFP